MGKETQNPIPDAIVVLCAIIQSEDKKCQFRPDMIASTGQDGSFVVTSIPAGNYVVVYALGKDADPKSWKETTVNYGPFALDAPFDPFGGNQSSRLVDGFQFTTTRRDDKLVAVPGEGALVSIALGLTLEYVGGDPVSAQVASGRTAEVEIRASGQ